MQAFGAILVGSAGIRTPTAYGTISCVANAPYHVTPWLLSLQVRTFSRDELRSLFRVNPSIPCETHNAIKCSCDGSLQAMESCKERAAAAASSSSGESEQQGVMAWAHLAKAADSPDPTWQTMTSFVRDNYVTYVFSDHVLDEVQPSNAPQQPAAAVVAGSSRVQNDTTGKPAGATAVAAAEAGPSSLKSSKRVRDPDGSTAEDDDEASQTEDESSASGDDSDSEADIGSKRGPAAVTANFPGTSRPSAARFSARPPLARRTSAGPAVAAAAAATKPASRLRRNSCCC